MIDDSSPFKLYKEERGLDIETAFSKMNGESRLLPRWC